MNPPTFSAYLFDVPPLQINQHQLKVIQTGSLLGGFATEWYHMTFGGMQSGWSDLRQVWKG